jgi:serine/threonine-protein kinase
MAEKQQPSPARASGRERAGDVRELQAGDEIAGKYQLVRLLGAGGMGAVWAARNEVLEIDVAIKFLRVSESARGVERFQQEARAAAGLGHPSIVRVLDFGHTAEGAPYLVMEYLEGLSLADLLDVHTRLTPQEAVQLVLPLCSALEEVHRKGIVHRDLKPDNVMIVAAGQGHRLPKLVDFGIVKLLDPVDGAARPLTLDGSVVGTPDYMSPEQARGRTDVDSRSDIWSLSVVLYEMVTGRRPFRADNHLALLSAIIDEVPTPLRELAAGDQDLWAILERGLAKEPVDRWQTMREFGRALAEWALARGVETDSTGASLAAHWLRDSFAPGREASTTSRAIGRAARYALAESSPTLDEAPGSRATAPPIEGPARSASMRPRRLPPRLLAAGLTASAALTLGWLWVDRGHLAPHEAPSSAAAPAPPPPSVAASLTAPPVASVAPAASAVASAAPRASASAGPGVPTRRPPMRAPAGKSTGVGDMPLPTSPTF